MAIPALPENFGLLIQMIVPLIFISLLILWVVWRLRPTPYITTSLKEARVPYTADNVSRWTTYHVWSHDTSLGQEFLVLNVVDGYMLVAVLSANWLLKKRREHFVFKGWTRSIRHDQLIDARDLLKAHPNDTRPPIDRLLSIRWN